MKSASTRNDHERFFHADMELHHTIWKLSGQPQLFRTLNVVMNPFIFMIARVYSSKLPIAERFESHRDYVNMALSTPPGSVQRAVERYFEQLYRRVFRQVLPPFHPSDGHPWIGYAFVDQLHR